jgi:osmoprotectant transport system permease protein
MSFLAQSAAGNPWFSWAYLRANADTIRALAIEHLSFTVEAVALAVVAGVPLAVLAYWVRPLTGVIVASAGVLYTIPSLALFAFLAPVLGPGRLTVLTGLVLYALLLVIRNTLTGLSQVPADVREAASAMGYGRLRRLLQVELPLALPSLLTGVRLATVSTVALVTVGVVLGRGGLGQLIYGGFRNNFHKAEILTGAVLCVLLAVLLDLLLIAAGRALTPWRRRRTA